MGFVQFRDGFVAVTLGLAVSGLLVSTAQSEDFSFTASNTTKSKVTEVLVSQDKAEWGYFDIGSGIKPGETVDLVWDQSTNGESCTQWVKATYADGTESEPAKFDFCENGLELDF